ncbi:TetR/AcrR family transcriptional regulator [Saccharopolyspora gloriosae]|uniref:TetR/AcrR family transcriptional regulator n=1 Tax=Saccharopolyspora gloriosae TaxID=455344 RepID=UPI001FB6CBFB|nr:TetR/AcrR family transcriptional regulator [Saccharopolyspora gloriosae]
MAETRPGGRTARTREAVHAAVRALWAEGRDPLTVREVSARSGVHEVTIYRRWKNVEALALDVAVTRMNEQSPFPDSGELRRDLIDWARSVADRVDTREGFAFYRAIAAATASHGAGHGPATEAAAIHLRRRTDQIQQVLDRAAADGAPRLTVEHVFDVVLAPIYLRAIFGYSTPGMDLEVLVDRVLTTP